MSKALESDSAVRLFYSFHTEGRLYGIEATQVREISTQVESTPVPQAPTAIWGLANLRSRIYLVVDIRPILGFAPTQLRTESRLIVFKPRLAENLGILVEQGGEIVSVSAAQVEEAPLPAAEGVGVEADRAGNIVVGVCKLDGKLMNIIDSAKLVEALEVLMQ